MSLEYNILLLNKKYEEFIDYVYPILLKCNNRHRVLRDLTIEEVFKYIKTIRVGLSSNQISKLYETRNSLYYINCLIKNLQHNKGNIEERRAFSCKQISHLEKLILDCLDIIDGLIENKK